MYVLTLTDGLFHVTARNQHLIETGCRKCDRLAINYY